METPRGEKKNQKQKQTTQHQPKPCKKTQINQGKKPEHKQTNQKKKNPKTTNPSKLHCKLDSVSCLN